VPLIHISWNDYLHLAGKIINHLKEEKYGPDGLIGISRGGLTPMVTLSGYFKTRQVGVAFIQKTSSDASFSKMLSKAIVHGYGIPFDVSDKKILIVDNIIQTGQTVGEVIKKMNQFGAYHIKVVSLCKHRNKYDFDHFSPMVVNPDDWIVFPWDVSPFNEE